MKTYVCETCGNTFTDQQTKSKRFCSVSCRKSYIGKQSGIARRLRPVEHLTTRKPFGTWKCDQCDFIGHTKKELNQHRHRIHNVHAGWNKGLTKDTDIRVLQQSLTFSANLKKGLFIPSFTGKHHSKKSKEKMSEKAKAGIKNSIHNTWAMSRHSTGFRTSNPEFQFIEFLRKIGINGYVRELPFFGFSLDFAWIEKRKCIEIDGEQHYDDRFDHSSDRRKDQMLKDKNWSFLRIRWEKEKTLTDLERKIKDFLDVS